MNYFFIFFLFVLFLHQSKACCSSCSTSNCNSCCSSCQQQCATSSCLNTCQNQCCQSSSSCCSACQQQCSTPSCVSTCQESCPQTERCETERVRERIETIGGGSSAGSLKADVSSYNIINNQNVLNLTIGVNSNVENNIKNEGSSTSDTEKVVQVPTHPIPKSSQCCVVIVPCVTSQCNPVQHRCHGCHGSYGYLPINPCQHGCSKKTTWTRQSCHLGQCISRDVDCNYCNEDFYQTYSGFSQCHGCFYADQDSNQCC